MDNVENCVVCGDVIPEGRQICPQCESVVAVAAFYAKVKSKAIERGDLKPFVLLEDIETITMEMVDRIRADAITEFAERLKTFYRHLPGHTVGGSIEYHINQILKEMKGELL
jgi:hypothetical protein